MDHPSASVATIAFLLVFVIAPLALMYRRGLIIGFNARMRFQSLSSNSNPKPSQWAITNTRRLSLIEKRQISRITVEYEYSINGIRIWAKIQVKGGKQFSFPIAEDVNSQSSLEIRKRYINNGDTLDKDALLVRTWEKEGQRPKYDLYPIN